MYNMLMKRRGAERRSDQRGFASIVIALVMVIVLSLITVGFAELMRKEERSALDKQLSSQAYYAAESGVNDAAKAINSGFREAKPDCKPYTSTDPEASLPGGSYLTGNAVGDSTGADYTCLTIDPSPHTLEYSSVSTDESKAVQLTGVNPADDSVTPIGSLEISWQDANGGASFVPGASTNFEKAGDWPYTGILRVGITPLISGCLNRDCLVNSSYTSFLYPNDSAAPVVGDSYPSGSNSNQGNITKGNCHSTNTPHYCVVKVTNLTAPNYLLSLRSVYKNTRVTIKAFGVGDEPLDILNAQTVVDSTGKAQDVLKRLQVRIPSQNNYAHADGVTVMDGICKQLQLMPAAVGTSSNDCTP